MESDVVISGDDRGHAVVRARRSLDAAERVGEVIVTLHPSDPAVKEFEPLAPARAWAQIAGEFLDRTDGARALTAARTGLVELGESYAGPGWLDDTDELLFESNRYERDQKLVEAAKTALRALESRLEMFRRRYEGDILS